MNDKVKQNLSDICSLLLLSAGLVYRFGCQFYKYVCVCVCVSAGGRGGGNV